MEQVDPVGDFFARAKRHRIAIATLCRRVGIDPTTPSRWKRKKNGPNLAKLRLLSQALDAVIAEDVGGDHDAENASSHIEASPGKINDNTRAVTA